MRRTGPTLLAVLLLGSCSPSEPAATTSMATTTTTPVATTSAPTTTTIPGPATTTTEAQGDTVTVLLYPTGEMGPGWTEQIFPYGETEDTLGTAPGGDGGLVFGPEYGVQAVDGTWWFMDAAKLRFAQFAEDGAYLSEAELPTEILVDGQYFQWQMPQPLDDSSVVISGFRGEASSSLLRFADGQFTETVIDASVPWALTDGELLYGFSAADGTPHSLDPAADLPVEVEWFLARDGSRFMVSVDGSDLTVDLPDAGVTKTLQLRFSDDPAVAAMAGIEVESTEDGSIHILAYGVPETDEGLEIGGIVTISPEGLVADSQPIVSPFSASDPGSPAHLGIRPGTDTLWFMVVDVDGVHVYTRDG